MALPRPTCELGASPGAAPAARAGRGARPICRPLRRNARQLGATYPATTTPLFRLPPRPRVVCCERETRGTRLQVQPPGWYSWYVERTSYVVRPVHPSTPSALRDRVPQIYGDSMILAECIFSQSATGEVSSAYFRKFAISGGVASQIFRKRAQPQRAVARPYAVTHLTVQPRPASEAL